MASKIGRDPLLKFLEITQASSCGFYAKNACDFQKYHAKRKAVILGSEMWKETVDENSILGSFQGCFHGDNWEHHLNNRSKGN